MVRTAPRLLDAEKNEVNYSVGNGSKVRSTITTSTKERISMDLMQV